MPKCSTVQQGYPSITHMHDCQLSHTGFDLWPILAIAILVIAAGFVFRWGARLR